MRASSVLVSHFFSPPPPQRQSNRSLVLYQCYALGWRPHSDQIENLLISLPSLPLLSLRAKAMRFFFFRSKFYRLTTKSPQKWLIRFWYRKSHFFFFLSSISLRRISSIAKSYCIIWQESEQIQFSSKRRRQRNTHAQITHKLHVVGWWDGNENEIIYVLWRVISFRIDTKSDEQWSIFLWFLVDFDSIHCIRCNNS